jgi:hypothetical protein
MKKQTAVEWLHEQLTSTWYDGKSSNLLLEVAKDMEKDQMLHCYENVFFNDSGSELKFEEYYNETYGDK